MDDEIRSLSKMMIAPLISRTGKALKIQFHLKQKKLSPIRSTAQLMTVNQIQAELKKIELEKQESLKESLKPKFTSCFRSVSRSSNVKNIQVSPVNLSPPPGTYNPNYNYLDSRVTGNIMYRKKSMVKSKSNKFTKIVQITESPNKIELESSKSQGVLDVISKNSSPVKIPKIPQRKYKPDHKHRNLTPQFSENL